MMDNIDLKNRRIFLFGDIDEKSAANVTEGIYTLSTQKRPISLIINSSGGDLYQVLGLYDIMMSANSPINTIGVGQIMSAAILLLAAGKKRYIGKSTSFMTHDISFSDYPETKLSTFRKEIKHLNDLRHRFFSTLCKHSKLGVKEWEDRSCDTADHFFTSTIALEYGIADKFLMEKLHV